MDKITGVLLAILIAASSFSVTAETFKRVELDRNRTSVQYAGPIKSVAKTIEGYKWLGQTKEMNGGVVFEAYDNPDFGKNDTESGGAIMVKAIFHTYQDVSKEAIMVARQSQIAGFVELYGYDSPDLQLHIRVVDDNTFQAFSSVEDYKNKDQLFSYKKVEQFNKNPQKDRLKSARDSGMNF
ncbi:DUF4825 domain-containing protein [Pseudomonas sp. IT-P171]|uniref:hypothetical protein n=1 Tax=Pseudomonas sp. IT-P171 TaxID=3026453 RepID=UPI0039E1AFDC